MTLSEYECHAAVLRKLKETHKQGKLTRQQYRTLYGQVMAGDPDAAMRGLRKILLRGGSVSRKMNVSQETTNRRESNEQTT